MKTKDDWDELAGALDRALPDGVEVHFPGKEDDRDHDLRLIPGENGRARLVIDLDDADTAWSEETIHLEWGVNEEDEDAPDLEWWTKDWARSGVGWTKNDADLEGTMDDLAGDVVGTVLDMVQHLAGGDREDGMICYNDEGEVVVDDDLRSVLVDAYDKGALDVRAFIREHLVDNISLQPEEGFADVRLHLGSDWVFVNERSGRTLNLDVDLRYPADGGSRCKLLLVGPSDRRAITLKRAAEAMLSPEDYEKAMAAVDWLIDEEAQ